MGIWPSNLLLWATPMSTVLSILLKEPRVFAKFDQFMPVRSHFDTKRPVIFFHIATFPSPTFGPLFAFHCPLFFTKNNNLECRDVLKTVTVTSDQKRYGPYTFALTTSGNRDRHIVSAQITPLLGYWNAYRDWLRARNIRPSKAQCTNICFNKSSIFSLRTSILIPPPPPVYCLGSKPEV